MKKLKLIYPLYFLIAVFVFAGCDTEPIDPVLNDYVPVEDGDAMFEVDFSGQTYEATATTVTMEEGTTTITAVRNTDGAVFSIVIPGTAPGTYATSIISYTPTSESQNHYINVTDTGMSGSVTINTINTVNHTISGTFSFTGYWSDPSANLPTIQFTNGKFTSLPYTSDTEPDPDPETGTPLFKVMIDGEEYIADNYAATVGNGLITISGERGTAGEYVGLAIDGTTEGTYTAEALFLAYSPDGGEDNVYLNIDFESGNSTGEVVITNINQLNHTISGTFSFVGVLENGDSKTFTQGEFTNIPYTTGVSMDDSEFKATVDGVAVDYVDDLVVGYANDDITINGIGADHTITLFIDGSLGLGSYPITDSPTATAKGTYEDENGNQYDAQEGTLIITNISDGWITGTFEFTIENESGTVIHEITNGTFHVEQ
ncbi:DUF6252 family protein [Flavobacterium rhizosphaerae]|uniref:DUF6252 family protein n=1 Tax=Flavobacterium rhizosphaerae TaxID=3163298 RepID=A0ABW8YTH8_9FLAO